MVLSDSSSARRILCAVSTRVSSFSLRARSRVRVELFFVRTLFVDSRVMILDLYLRSHQFFSLDGAGESCPLLDLGFDRSETCVRSRRVAVAVLSCLPTRASCAPRGEALRAASSRACAAKRDSSASFLVRRVERSEAEAEVDREACEVWTAMSSSFLSQRSCSNLVFRACSSSSEELGDLDLGREASACILRKIENSHFSSRFSLLVLFPLADGWRRKIVACSS